MANRAAKRVILAAVAANLLIALTKFVAAWFTASSAMSTEGVHSLVDTGDQLLLLYGLWRASRPASEEFPFGHGKELYFWSFVVSLLVFAAGAGVSIYEGILHLLRPREMTSVLVNYIVLAVAMVFEGISWAVSVREFGRRKGRLGYIEAIHRGKDPSLFVVILEDTAALLGLAAAMVGVTLAHLTGSPAYDGVASLLIGLILAATAVILARETKGLLVGESALLTTRRNIHDVVAATPGVERVEEILTLQMGPEFVLVTVSARFADDTPVAEIAATVARMKAEIMRRVPGVKRVFVEPRS